MAALAAACGSALSGSHPYRDGSKQVAFLVLVVFLELNAWRLDADEADVVTAMVALADGSLSEKDLAVWIRNNSTRSRRK